MSARFGGSRVFTFCVTMTIHEVRALEAYFRSGGTEQTTSPQTFEIVGKSYVVLNNVRGILAVYRIKPNGCLRRLVRYPRALNRMV
jgi:hypothetical protein